MNNKMTDTLERQELIQKLIDKGHGPLIDAMLNNEQVFTRGNRLNKSGACRVLNWKTKQLEEALADCRQILGTDFC